MLRALLDEATAGNGRLVAVSGEAGVGKTTLVAHLAASCGPEVAVRRGMADNITAGAALGVVIDALPELADLAADATQTRLSLFGRIRSLLAAAPTLLVLEDVHWADEASLDLVRFLGRRLDGIPVLVVMTFRSEEVLAHPLSVVLGDLGGPPAVARLALRPLTEQGVKDLTSAYGDPVDARALHRQTGGNPFYVTEILAAPQDELPATIRDAVLARTVRLSEPAHRVLASAAVLGRRVDTRLLGAVSGQPEAAIMECVDHGVLLAEEDAWAFRHELGRLAVDQTLTPSERATLNRRALHELELVEPDNHRALGHHAAACGDWPAVLDHATRAAETAARLGAHRESAAEYRLALRAPSVPAETRAGLLEALSYECYLTDQLNEALTARRQAMELYELAGDLVAVGTSQRWLSRLSWFLARNEDAERYARRAVATLEPLGPSPALAMAYSNVAQLRMLRRDAAGAVDWGTRALDLAQRLPDREVQIHALNNVGSALAIQDRPDGWRYLAESLELALDEDAHEHAARAYTNLGNTNVELLRLGEANRVLRKGIAYCEDRDLDSWTYYMSGWLAICLTEQGHYDEAVEIATRLLRQPRLAPVSRIQALLVAAKVGFRRGEDASSPLEQASALAVSTGEAQRVVPVALARAEAAWLGGRTDLIEAMVDHAWPLAEASRNPWQLGELTWWLSLAGFARTPAVPIAPPFSLMVQGEWSRAAGAWESLGAPLWVAYSLGRSDDVEAARRALKITDEFRAYAVRDAIMRHRHACGQVVPRGPRPSSRAHPSLLTERELDVLRLMGDGMSNADIASRLVLSERTVGHHVSAILRKLGEPSRGRAVAAATRDGLLGPT